MTTREVVALAQSACQRAELELAAARQRGNALHLQLARLHWECTLRDLHRALVAVGS
jgi:hypothetical protein